MRRAKILATLGPASNTPEIIEAMFNAGMNAVRINMSHGTHDEHAETIKTARAAAKKLDMPLAILVDLSGPKIRTGLIAKRHAGFAGNRRGIYHHFARHRRHAQTRFRPISRNCRSSSKKATKFCSTTARSN